MTAEVGSLRIAAWCDGTRALGPGRRAVAWVQGCPFECLGCIAPEWIPAEPAMRMAPRSVVDVLLRDESVEGLTFSGGEPMLQAAGLTAVAREARRRRPLSLICFTGFRLEQLLARPPAPGVDDLLAEMDVLIDGRYVRSLDDGRGLRGSTNQRIHHLTDQLRHCDYELLHGERVAEIRLSDGEALLVGVPPPGVAAAFDRAVRLAGHRSRSPFLSTTTAETESRS